MHKWLGEQLAGIGQNIAAVGVLAILVAAAVAAWAALKSAPAYLVVLIFVAMLALVIQILIQGPELWRRFRRPRTPRAWEKALMAWCYRQGWEIQDDATGDTLFRFIVKPDRAAGGINVYIPKGAPETVSIHTAIGSSDEVRDAMSNLSLTQRKFVVHETQLELLRFGVEVPKIDEEQVQILQRFPCQTLDQQEFLKHLFLVRRACIAALLTFSMTLERVEGNPNSQSTPDTAAQTPKPTS